MAGGEGLITRSHLSDDFIEDADRSPAPQASIAAVLPDAPAPAAADTVIDAPATTLEALELQTIRRAVEEAGGNISVASKRLGISRNTIYRKLRWRQIG
jgi:transcriptional regulator of acetoin/glycerol metabolism